MEKLLWSVREAALALGLSPYTVRAFIRRGQLNAVRLGRRVLLESAELSRLIARGREL